MGVNQKGRQYRRSSAPGGFGTGALLGAASEVESPDPERAYAEWLAKVDFDAIVDGAEIAAARSEQMPGVDNSSDAGVLGAAAGLSYSYADVDADMDEIDEHFDSLEDE